MRVFTRRACLQHSVASLGILALAPGLASAGPKASVGVLRALDKRMVTIPGGPFWMGTDAAEIAALSRDHDVHPTWFDGELPLRLVDVPTFAIAKFPVTVLEYSVFVAATGYHAPPTWLAGQPPKSQLTHPVTAITHVDALAFAAWAGVRLPTEAEWEKAARGLHGNTYPWGDVFDPAACRWNSDPLSAGPGTSPVGMHPLGVSPFGVHELVGNVAEWCADGPASSTSYVKGGSWMNHELVHLRPAARNMTAFSTVWNAFLGFRCAKDVS
ncbi:MAG: SUMF1/EgtB/PvdO family nonheme iron enzyme [Planctomycetes bacterium]|nr:SUMF1/EgtB/PvdO family nonheme iron enzyme [Planctomycetota bacterium]